MVAATHPDRPPAAGAAAPREAAWEWDINQNAVQHDAYWMEMLGYAGSEQVRTIEAWRRMIHPDDLASCELSFEDHLAMRRDLYEHEHRLKDSSGGWKWVLDRGRVTRRAPDGRPLVMAGTHTDITERKSRELELRLEQGEELTLRAARQARLGGWELEPASDHLAWSEVVRAIHEVGESYQPTPASALEFFPPEAREKLRVALAEAEQAGRAFTLELPLITARGHELWVRIAGAKDPGSGLARISGTLQDITADIRGAQARTRLEVQLFQAQKMESLATLAGGIAHDFNNLLTGIIGYHELAADSVPADDPAAGYLAEARKASLRARELVEKILTFGRQQSATEQSPLDLTFALEEACRALRPTLPANVTLRTNVAPGCSQVFADPTQIHQVLLSLSANSLHAMRAHGGTLEFSLQLFEVGADRGQTLAGAPVGRYVRLSVRDTGHGIEEHMLRRIFDPFFTTKSIREGTGLGLAVVHGIVRIHRGSIDVESVPGKGTTFHIYLPAITPEKQPELSGHDEDDVPAVEGLRVCVVDDESLVAQGAKTMLETRGHQVIVFSSAEDCLAALADGVPPWDIILTDQSMLGMSGTALAAEVRKRAQTLPIVIMSGFFSNLSAQTLEELGHIWLLAKPYTISELLRSIYRAIHAVRTGAKAD
jgi:PAS domain S-box-containing protein